MEKEHNFLYDMVNDTFEQMFSPEWVWMPEKSIQEYIIKVVADFHNHNEKIFFVRNLRKSIVDRIGESNSLMKRVDKDRYNKFYNISEWICTLNLENGVSEITKKKSESQTEKSQRVVNSDKLKDYFVSTFKGMGNGTINHFNTMIDELKTDRIAKEFAQIALMIYDSGKLNDRKPKAFAKWYELFCECIGCEKKTYKPKDLKPLPENLKKLFNYL